MSKPSRLFVVVAVFVLGLAWLYYLQAPATAQEKPKENAPAAAAVKWEYRIVALRERLGGKRGGEGLNKAEEDLNKLGEEGFEIAFVTAASGTADLRGGFGKGGFGGGGDLGGGDPFAGPPVVYYTLKRAKK
jgi:hypothetical protein